MAPPAHPRPGAPARAQPASHPAWSARLRRAASGHPPPAPRRTRADARAGRRHSYRRTRPRARAAAPLETAGATAPSCRRSSGSSDWRDSRDPRARGCRARSAGHRSAAPRHGPSPTGLSGTKRSGPPRPACGRVLAPAAARPRGGPSRPPPSSRPARKLLRLLATDGRSSYQALADEVGLSRPAVMERVKRLEEAGYISGYGARVDRGKAGFPVTAFVAVRYASSDYVGDEPRMREMEKHPGVLECHHVAGEDCYILKVAVPDLERLQDLLRDLRGPSPSVEMSTRTTIVLGTVFEKPGFVPTELD